MNKHTPGPWATSLEYPKLIKSAPDFLGESNVLICAAHGHPDSGFFPSEEEAIANAHLIAAAPELLDALILAQGIVAMFGGTPDPEDPHADQIQIAVQAQIRLAIAKATGGSQ